MDPGTKIYTTVTGDGFFKRQTMCQSQIFNMNIAPDTRPIRRVIICPENFNILSFPVDCLQNQRNQVSFQIMAFPDFSIMGAALTRNPASAAPTIPSVYLIFSFKPDSFKPD